MPKQVDLHMHTSFSDGTDTPEELLIKVREAGLALFSVTDHDTVDGCRAILPLLRGTDGFVCGVELSSTTALRKCHILGYHFRLNDPSLTRLTDELYTRRLKKLDLRLDELDSRFHIRFSEKDVDALRALPRPGKAHLAALLVRYGYAASISAAFADYLDVLHLPSAYIDAADAVEAIHRAGGVAVWAHPLGGENTAHLTHKAFTDQLTLLTDIGIDGLECYYSRYNARESSLLTAAAQEKNLYITAGSDYHGERKDVPLGGFYLP